MSISTGARIRARRKELGLTQETVGHKVGVTKGAVSNWETGSAAVLGRNLVKLARALDTTPEWLMGQEEQSDGALELAPGRLEAVLKLIEALPKHEQASLSISKRARLIAYLYGRDITAMKPSDVAGLLVLLK